MMQATIRIYCDGGARGNPGPAAIAFLAFDGNGKLLAKDGKFIGQATNNVAEYTAVLLALNWLVKNAKENAVFFLDSELVANQLAGRFKIKDKKLIELAKRIKQIEKDFPKKIFYKNIPRIKNKTADALVNKILDENLK
jgi:ribonuclease HI